MNKNYAPQQTSKWLTKQLNKAGCYFMSIMWGVGKYLDKEIKPYQIMKIYEDVVAKGYMTFGCYILNPAKIGTAALEELGSNDRFYYVGSERDGHLDFYKEALHKDINLTIDNIQILWEDKNGKMREGKHFVTSDFNPDNNLIPTGKIYGHRYFKIGAKNETL